MRAALALIAIAATACAGVSPKAKTMEPCTKTLRPGASLADEIAALPAHGTLCLEPGTYSLNVVIDKPLTLRGTGPGETILDGGGRTSVIRVNDKPHVTLERLTITGGANRNGGAGVNCGGFAEVTLREVVLRGNRSDAFGGAGLYAAGGTVTLERCRVVGNSGGIGGAIIADGVATVVLRQTLVADNVGSSSAIYVHDNAELTLDHATVAGNRAVAALEVRAIAVRAPSVAITDSIVAGETAIANGPRLPGEVTMARSLVDGTQGAVKDGGGNHAGAAQFVGDGPEPWRPKAGSPAIGIAHAGAAVDLAGTPSGTTAGALQPTN